MPGWRGIVDCEVLEVREQELLRSTWIGSEGEAPSYVTYLLELTSDGTHFTYHHTGFAGVGRGAMAKMLGAIRRKMLTVGMPALLAELDETGTLRAPAQPMPEATSRTQSITRSGRSRCR
jgi:uncharacterized protein YndB with AHSA1/START domain